MTYTHDINPILISIGFIDLYWYGAMYAISFILIDYLMKKNNVGDDIFTVFLIDKILIVSLFSLLIGGRLGYVVFYNFGYYSENLYKILYIWEGGMSFHGALIGIIVGLFYISIKEKINFLKLTDFVVIYIPIGLFLGRIGNFINSELYGSPTNASWGVIFPLIDDIPRHPSMLYEAILEGLILFYVMLVISKSKPNKGILTSLFLIMYSVFRSSVEFIRVPDIQIGHLYSNWLTMGMILSLPMFMLGMTLLYFSIKGRIR